ncbi:hypothetical protein MSZK_05540 [Mycobacterium sp. shizuoka-1]|nr:hypothetical protein MSZK_05540 [Mycobacterium sp. shizuoka-1]
MDTCTAEFARLSAGLTGLRCDANPIVTFTNPFALASWTMPVIEFLLIAGAVAALVHALRWRRATGDQSNLVVWICSVLSLLMIEPVAYFPQWFGVQDVMGLTFVHNQFSIQFLYDRLPLYIVAMYPAYAYLAWVLVQRTGIFARYHPVVGAASVAFVFHCFYEVVDTVGVQFRWWVWNTDLPTSHPALGVVPYVNLQAFSIGLPFGLALATLVVSRWRESGRRRLARDVVVVCVCIWPLQFLSSLPSFVIDWLGASVDTGRLVGTWLMIAACGLLTCWAFAGAYRARRADPASVLPIVRRDYFALVSAAVYLIACVVFWTAALPDHLAAVHGVTPTGAPTGSLPYAAVTFVMSIALTAGAYLASTGNPPAAQAAEPDPRRTVSA